MAIHIEHPSSTSRSRPGPRSLARRRPPDRRRRAPPQLRAGHREPVGTRLPGRRARGNRSRSALVAGRRQLRGGARAAGAARSRRGQRAAGSDRGARASPWSRRALGSHPGRRRGDAGLCRAPWVPRGRSRARRVARPEQGPSCRAGHTCGDHARHLRGAARPDPRRVRGRHRSLRSTSPAHGTQRADDVRGLVTREPRRAGCVSRRRASSRSRETRSSATRRCDGTEPDSPEAENRLTAVRRPWRRRGIASALKRAQIEAARAAGIETIATTNDELNVGMRGVNERLGYEPEPERVVVSGPA